MAKQEPHSRIPSVLTGGDQHTDNGDMPDDDTVGRQPAIYQPRTEASGKTQSCRRFAHGHPPGLGEDRGLLSEPRPWSSAVATIPNAPTAQLPRECLLAPRGKAKEPANKSWPRDGCSSGRVLVLKKR